MYQVRIGLSQEIKLMTENTGDAIDLAIVCLENGYRVTIIPVDDDVKEVTQGGYDKWEKEEASELDMAGIGERIKARLDEMEMSQRELSEKCKYMIRRQDVIDELMTWEGHCITDQEEWHLRQVIGSIKSIHGGENDT